MFDWLGGRAGRGRAVRWWLAGIGVSALAAGCGDSPSLPASPTAPQSLARVTIQGGEVVPLDGIREYRLVATYSDFTERDVTAEGAWSSTSPLVSFDAPGVVRGRSAGSAAIRAAFQGRSTAQTLLVLPAGTFRLQGRVTEAASSGFRVGGARVTVAAGIGAGLTTLTDSAGNYVFYGVAGPVRLELAKDGYHAETRTLEVADHTTRVDVEFRLVRPHPDLSGVYTLTLSASERCGTGLGSGSLPDEARSRSYTMNVAQEGPRLRSELSGPGVGGSPFVGRLEPGRIVWDFYNDNDMISVDVVIDRLPSGALFVASGSAALSLSGGSFAGTLNGALEVLDPARQRTAPPLASCSAGDHRFVMTR